MNTPSDVGLVGALKTPEGDVLQLEMSAAHWQNLKLLLDNEDAEGSIVSLLMHYLKDPALAEYQVNQLVMWFIEDYMDKLSNLIKSE